MSKRKLNVEHIKSNWGWIEITPGGKMEHSGILTLTEFNVEEASPKPQSLVKCLQWLKRDFIKKNAVYGVFGGKPVNQNSPAMKTHPDHEKMFYYRYITYTEGAVDLFKQGCVWKQNLSNRSVFIPKSYE